MPRDDVAAVLHHALNDRRASRCLFYLNGGEDSIEQALAGACRPAYAARNSILITSWG
ncbi:MAG TPA: hypothetical protein VMU39_12055 [Solirubrobacteraceae bacterium]|nr:hypothetical protein [Solirubrobacteraceae bacterium]